MTTPYRNGGGQACSPSEIALPGRVETLLERIYRAHNVPPVKVEIRRILSSISEELAVETLSKVCNAKDVKTLGGFIIFLLGKAAVTVNASPRLTSGESPAQSPSTPVKKTCRSFQGQYHY